MTPSRHAEGRSAIQNHYETPIIWCPLLHPLHFGGVWQKSTTDAGFFLTEYIRRARDQGLHTTTLALDMAQYFPSLNHDAIVVSVLPEDAYPLVEEDLPEELPSSSDISTHVEFNQTIDEQ